MLSPELLNQVAGWRAKVADGTITREELQKAILVLRENRRNAAAPVRKTSSSRSKAPVDANALLADLDGL
jgi:hypothetical protein